MKENKNKFKLFLVMLGGRTNSSHIELHDLRWVIGKNIKETYQQLRNQWFGLKQGLHIDSYMEVNFIDGYEIVIKERNNKKTIEYKENMSLWFVNLGGYTPKKLSELHEFSLVVAENKYDAVTKAKKQWLHEVEQIHKDDISEINGLSLIDECFEIKDLFGWEIQLIIDPEKRNQELKPDWYGYRRIDT